MAVTAGMKGQEGWRGGCAGGGQEAVSSLLANTKTDKNISHETGWMPESQICQEFDPSVKPQCSELSLTPSRWGQVDL